MYFHAYLRHLFSYETWGQYLSLHNISKIIKHFQRLSRTLPAKTLTNTVSNHHHNSHYYSVDIYLEPLPLKSSLYLFLPLYCMCGRLSDCTITFYVPMVHTQSHTQTEDKYPNTKTAQTRVFFFLCATY